jgi:acyl carrier protein
MGMLFVPPGVVPGQSLGLKSYPKTVAGKIQKSTLEDLMKVYCGKRNPPPRGSECSDNSHGVVKSYSGSQIVHSLLSAIAEEKGVCVNPETRIIDLGVDSMTFIAILSRVQKETGVSLPSTLFFIPKTVGTISDYLRSTSSPAGLLDLRRLTDDTYGDFSFSTLRDTRTRGVFIIPNATRIWMRLLL